MADASSSHGRIKPPQPGPDMSMSSLMAAVERLDQEMARLARGYEDAALIQKALGDAGMAGIMQEVLGLEARRDALILEIGALEGQLAALKVRDKKA